jgi:hypothetical protein
MWKVNKRLTSATRFFLTGTSTHSYIGKKRFLLAADFLNKPPMSAQPKILLGAPPPKKSHELEPCTALIFLRISIPLHPTKDKEFLKFKYVVLFLDPKILNKSSNRFFLK